MSLRVWKWITILLPTLMIGGFEYIRHELLMSYLSMETGNLYMTLLTFALSFLFATWMFRKISRMSERVAEEQAKRAVLEERERIAGKLHDDIAQNLFFLNVMMKQGKWKEAQEAMTETDQNIRQAIFHLQYVKDEPFSLQARLNEWLDTWSSAAMIDVERDIQADGLTDDDEIQLFAIIQEAFTNIRKHSKASHAEIRLRADGRSMELIIVDDGVGMRADAAHKQTYGLSIMQRRAEALEADLQVGVGEHGGTRFQLSKGERGGKG